MDIDVWIYAGNMPFDVTEKLLRETFTTVGTIEAVKLAIDSESGRFMGYAFVKMSNEKEVTKAIKELQGKEIMGDYKAGRNMYLEPAKNEKDLWENIFRSME